MGSALATLLILRCLIKKMKIDTSLTVKELKPKIDRLWKISSEKIHLIEKHYNPAKGSPVYTVRGNYTTRGWTEWTQGFQYGSAILQFDATGEKEFLDIGRRNTLEKMASHVSHIGVHDHGFNNISTYGNLLRLLKEGKIPSNDWEHNFYELALKISGAVQAARWTPIPEGGFIHSFNGPHSLFVDTIRSCRILAVSHALGHILMTENDQPVNLLERALLHTRATAQYSIYYGEGRDRYDERGRTAHESVFNTRDGNYRCPNAQQGYSGFTTWTRGLAWAMCGFSEQLEFLQSIDDSELEEFGSRDEFESLMLKAARATCDWYIVNTPVCGIPFWDAGAPKLQHLGDYLERIADPYNEFEPVDSSAAAIGSQGLLRLGRYLNQKGRQQEGLHYWQAGLTILKTLFDEPYMSTASNHQGLILHSIYHYPKGWDHIPEDSKIPNGESSMWGDYHAREVALYVHRIIQDEPYYTFYGGVRAKSS